MSVTTIMVPMRDGVWLATDMHPPSADYRRGYAMILCDGIPRLRYSKDAGTPRLRQPGDIVRIAIVLGPIVNLFLVGHRIRLDIGSSNLPKLHVNPNTREPEGMARRKRTAANAVFADAGRPGRAVLPLTAYRR